MEENHSTNSLFKEQSKLIEMIASDNLSLHEILTQLIQALDLVMPTIKSTILLFDEKTKTLGDRLGPGLPEKNIGSISGIKMADKASSFGTAALYKEMTIVEDIKNDPLWAEVPRDLKHFSAFWSNPLLSPAKDVLGTMAFYCEEKRSPTLKELEIIETFSNLAALMIINKRTEEKLFITNAVVEKSPVILMKWKAEKGWPLEYVTDNVSQLGYAANDFLSGKINFYSIVHPEDRDRVTQEVEYYSKNKIEKYKQEYRIIAGDGTVKWIDDRTIIQRDDTGSIMYYQGALLDITERKDAEKTIKFLADNDALTNLPNRRKFMEQLFSEIEQAKSSEELVAVFFLDLDNFNDVNDIMGHHFGDQLLKQVASKLTKNLPNQCVLSRVSGDEFAFILSNSSDTQVVKNTADKLLTIFEEPFHIDEEEFQITTSIGVSLYPLHGEDPEILLKQADLAMYNAKKSGKNNFQLFSKKIDEKRLLRKQLLQEIEVALKDDQFTLYYQPQINICTNEIYGVEALIRWNHPVRGLVSPIEFIPLAEETGLIFEIDKWVLQEACRQLALWEKSGQLTFSMSINISARQFYSEKLVSNVAKVLNEMQVDPRHLTLEMTEGTLMTDTEKTINVLNSLKQLGVNTALDDFGTGYSSLSYLKYLPINKLKIDRSFLTDITTDERDASILETIFTLAHHLNLDIISEGVETEEQLNYLKRTRCNVAQGYYYSRPVPALNIEEYFKENYVEI